MAASRIILVIISLLICMGLWVYLAKSAQKPIQIALGGILGGALGNVIDRVVWGHVIDFLDFHWHGLHWPAFNLADSAIFVGAALLIFTKPVSAPDHKL